MPFSLNYDRNSIKFLINKDKLSVVDVMVNNLYVVHLPSRTLFSKEFCSNLSLKFELLKIVTLWAKPEHLTTKFKIFNLAPLNSVTNDLLKKSTLFYFEKLLHLHHAPKKMFNFALSMIQK